MNKKILYLLFLVVFIIFPSAKINAEETLTYNGYEYYINSNSEAVITRYIANESEVIIPSEINGHIVTTIDRGAFMHFLGMETDNIETIVIPSSVNYIGLNAFVLLDNVTIYVNSYDVVYETPYSGNVIYSVSTYDYKLYVISKSGSSTEEYFNQYYAIEYYDTGDKMKWNELCGQTYYTNEDWFAPDSVSFSNNNDVSINVSTTDDKQYVTFPNISIYHGSDVMNGDTSNPFDNYDAVKLMYSTSVGGEKKDLSSTAVDKGSFQAEFTTAGTYYVYPVFERKAGSTYLASNYMSDKMLYGNPIKVTVNKKLYVPDNNNITVKYKLSAVDMFEVKNGDTIQLDLPFFKTKNENSIYVSLNYNAPAYDKNNYNFDNNSLITVSTNNDVATTNSTAYQPITFGTSGTKAISLNKPGQTTITLKNGYGLNFTFTVNVNFVYAKSASTVYTENNRIYLQNGSTYNISDLLNVEWGSNYTDNQKNAVYYAYMNGSDSNLPFTINSNGTITINNLQDNSFGSFALVVPTSKYGDTVGAEINYTTASFDYTKEPYYYEYNVADNIMSVNQGETLDISLSTDKTYFVEYSVTAQYPSDTNPTVATVDENGLVKGVSSGNIWIKAKAPTSMGYRMYYISVKKKSTNGGGTTDPVTPVKNYYENKTEQNITLYVDTNQSTYNIAFANATNYGGFNYYVSGGDGSVSLNDTTITAVKAGSSIVEAKPVNGSGYIRYNVTVKKGSIELNNQNTVSLLVKKSFTGKIVAFGVDNDSIASVSSSNTKIATVKKSGSNGYKITGKKKGTAKITIVTKAGVKKTITIKVSSSKSLKPSVTVSKSSISLRKGKNYTVEPVIKAVVKNGKITYSTTNKKIATVNSKGKITAKKKKGTCYIQIKMDGRVVKKIKVKVK